MESLKKDVGMRNLRIHLTLLRNARDINKIKKTVDFSTPAKNGRPALFAFFIPSQDNIFIFSVLKNQNRLAIQNKI